MNTNDPHHVIGTMRAHAALHEIDRLREHHDDLFREYGRNVGAQDLRHIRQHAANLILDIDRIVAELEGVPVEEVRLRQDSDAIAAMVAVVLRRHGEAVARMALAAVQEPPVDADAETRREAKPAEPTAGTPSDRVPAAEPTAPSVQAPAPSTDAREVMLAEMAAIERTDVPAFRDRPTRRTTDLTTDEELQTARSHPMGRPGSRPRPASAPEVDDELFGDLSDPPPPDPPVLATRSSDLRHLVAFDHAVQQLLRDEIHRCEKPVEPPPRPFPDWDAPLAADSTRPWRPLFVRGGFPDEQVEAYVAKHGLVRGPDVVRRTAKLGAASWNLVADRAAAAGLGLPDWCERKLVRWQADGCPTPSYLLVPMDPWHGHDIGLLLPVDIDEAVVTMARSNNLYISDVFRALLVDGLVAPGSESDAGLFLDRVPLVRPNAMAKSRTTCITTYIQPPKPTAPDVTPPSPLASA